MEQIYIEDEKKAHASINLEISMNNQGENHE
jgi:hypothetical protein